MTFSKLPTHFLASSSELAIRSRPFCRPLNRMENARPSTDSSVYFLKPSVCRPVRTSSMSSTETGWKTNIQAWYITMWVPLNPEPDHLWLSQHYQKLHCSLAVCKCNGEWNGELIFWIIYVQICYYLMSVFFKRQIFCKSVTRFYFLVKISKYVYSDLWLKPLKTIFIKTFPKKSFS